MSNLPNSPNGTISQILETALQPIQDQLSQQNDQFNSLILALQPLPDRLNQLEAQVNELSDRLTTLEQTIQPLPQALTNVLTRFLKQLQAILTNKSSSKGQPQWEKQLQALSIALTGLTTQMRHEVRLQRQLLDSVNAISEKLNRDS
jgi:chromosome segregation ATPase